jgi:hypothetical protein
MKTTLAPKFGGHAQRWGRAGLGKRGVGWNPGPPIYPPLTPPPPPWPPSPKAKGKGGGREEEGEKKGRGCKWGEGGGAWKRGCMGWVHAPPPPLAAPPKIC